MRVSSHQTKESDIIFIFGSIHLTFSVNSNSCHDTNQFKILSDEIIYRLKRMNLNKEEYFEPECRIE